MQTKDQLLDVARAAASAGSRIVAARFGEAALDQESKGRTGDWVTGVDRQSEEAIRSVLEARTPAVPVLGEESGGDRGDSYWAVDPLDGTTNFVIGFPVVAVSIALVVDGRPEVAVVEAPLLGLTFHAVRGEGAWSGDDPMRVSARPPERGIVATALPFRQRSLLPRYQPVLRRVFDRVEDVRRAGAAALDLAWVAAGVFDGYFELTLSVWDVAAGGLIVEEAGGLVTDWDGGSDYLSGNVLAGSPATHEVLLAAATARDPEDPQEPGRPAPT